MFRLRWLSVCCLGVLAWSSGGADSCRAADARPNVIAIIIDDFGYGDLGVHGCTDIPTPYMDSIANNGVRCTNGYVSAPQCSPTRAGFMTGRYQQRFGHEHNSAIADSALSLKETTLSARLKAVGYATGMVGKWHLGSDDEHRPEARGFDEFFGFLGGANPYLPRSPMGTVPRILRGRTDAKEKELLTEAFGREAVAYIDRHQKEPFFLYLTFNAPHGPMEAGPRYLERFAGIQDEQRRTYAAMVSALDDAIGTVLDKLRSAGLEDNTFISLFSDNGGPTEVNASRNTPFRGVKGETREGGIRTPFFVQWKRRLPVGTTYDQPVIQLDLHPTILAAAGVSVPANAKLDGVNLLPYLTGQKAEPPHETLYWRFSFPPGRPESYKWAIRQGDWKLFSDIGKGDRLDADAAVKLVNLADDIAESRDLSQQHPDKVRTLVAAWKKWNAELAPPPAKRAE
ncbi:MAG: sulfatase-like hydrolase/transferase [Planctomycetaceae bacterium]|nr:sulfatase-like hydrolase/transferase [Planctomycetaceae bacterium]